MKETAPSDQPDLKCDHDNNAEAWNTRLSSVLTSGYNSASSTLRHQEPGLPDNARWARYRTQYTIATAWYFFTTFVILKSRHMDFLVPQWPQSARMAYVQYMSYMRCRGYNLCLS